MVLSFMIHQHQHYLFIFIGIALISTYNSTFNNAVYVKRQNLLFLFTSFQYAFSSLNVYLYEFDLKLHDNIHFINYQLPKATL